MWGNAQTCRPPISSIREVRAPLLRLQERRIANGEWGVMLVFGMLRGAFIAPLTGGELTAAWVPAQWEDRFGPYVALRWVSGSPYIPAS